MDSARNENLMYYKHIKIEKAETLNPDYFILWIKDAELAELTSCGQFYEIKPLQYGKLRKPISVYDVEKDYIGFMIKVLGKGTELLSHLKKGDMLDLIGPLGTAFPLVEGKKIALVSGGIGYPPLWYLRKKLNHKNKVYWLHGGNRKTDIFPCDEIWTVDGSLGNPGFVSQGLETLLKYGEFDLIYACGPEPMLKAVAQIAKLYEVKLYVSMEAYMACGIGVCHGCVVPTGKTDEIVYKTVCKDGAVFDAEDICWEAL